jgi:DNA polymerase
MTECHIDFESRNPLVGPADVGLHNYIFSPETEPLFMWYKFSNSNTEKDYECWRIWETGIKGAILAPWDLHQALLDPDVMFVAFNSAFERYMLKKIGYRVPASRFIDPQVGGRYLSLPASLEVQGKVLGLPPHLAKRETDLIQFFCKHQIVKATKKREGRASYNDWNSHPKEWAEFLEYGRQDVVAEGELLRRMRLLGALPLPEFEQRLWIFDQKVNDRGMPVDVGFVRKMYTLALRAKAEKKKEFEDFTGVLNANSPAQVKAWAKPQGYPFDSLKKDTVASVLKDPTRILTDACRTALKMRAEAASTSYQKLGKILECVSPDGRVHGQFIFMGSSRCGRWSGNAVQLHNMARPLPPKDLNGYDFEDQKVVQEARAMVHAEDYDGIKLKYGSVLLVVKCLIRTVFVAP